MKKLLSMLIVGLFTVVGSFASADTVDGFTSDTEIVAYNFSDVDSIEIPEIYNQGQNEEFYMCISSSSVPFYIYIDDYYHDNSILVSSQNYCFNSVVHFVDGSVFFSENSVNNENWDSKISVNVSGKFYSSDSPITYSSSSDNGGSDSLLNPGVISSGVQSGVSSFTAGLGNIIPTLLIIGLPVLIIMLFRKYIRSWLKHIIVVDKPRGDDVFNCNLKMSKDGNIYHDFTKDGVEYVYVDGINVEKEVLPDYVDENLNFDKLDRKSENVYYNNYWDNLHYMGLSDDEIDILFEKDMKAGKTPEEASSMSDYDRKYYDEYMEGMAYEYGFRSKKYKKLDDEYIVGFRKHNGL